MEQCLIRNLITMRYHQDKNRYPFKKKTGFSLVLLRKSH